MKTYEEMAQNALRRIGEQEAIQKKRRQSVRKIAAPTLSLFLIAALGFGVWKSGLFRAEAPAPLPDSGLAQSFGGPEIPKNDPDTPPEVAQLPVEERQLPDEAVLIPDAGEATEPALATPGDFKNPDFGTQQGYIYLWWDEMSVSGALYHAIEAEPDGKFEVLATYRPATANIEDFVFEGKPLSEWAIEADNERILPERMTTLLKLGDELKYGEALCETGMPDGTVWDKNLYENTVSFIGEELLSRYISGGSFLRDALEADIAALPTIPVTTPDGTTTVVTNAETGARKQYARAYAAYLESILPGVIEELKQSGVECSRTLYQDNGISMTVSAEELQALPLEHPECWYFDLIAGEMKNAAETVTDASGLQVVN